MVIGQNPGQQEDKEGVPFFGRSGQLLRKLCDAAHISPSEVYRTNAVRCLSPGNRAPKTDELTNCRDYLIQEIREINPKVIITLGEVPFRSLVGMAGKSVEADELQTTEQAKLMAEYDIKLEAWRSTPTKERKALGVTRPLKPRFTRAKTTVDRVALRDVAGHTFIQSETGIPVIPTYHPAFLMRGQWAMMSVVIAHLEKARRIADGEQAAGRLGSYYTVESIEELNALRDYLIDPASGDTIWFDTETTGLSWQSDELLCISFSMGEGEGFVVPILHNPGDGVPDLYPPWENHVQELVNALHGIFGSSKDKGGHNVLFDCRMLERSKNDTYINAATAFGIKVNGRIRDTELLHHALAESLPHNMTSVLAVETDMPFYESDVKSSKKIMGKVDNSKLWSYSAADADGLPRMWNSMRPRAEAEGVDWVLDNVTAPMISVCRDIERRGFPIDLDYFHRLNRFYEDQIGYAEAAVWKAAPHKAPGWKYNYAPALREVLFKDLGLSVSGRKTKSGRGCEDCRDGVCFVHDQTGKDALEDMVLAGETHPILPAIMTVKNLTKRHSTYLAGGRGGLLRYVKNDGRIHPSMKISRTETGRLASSEPNAQNIPSYSHIHPEGTTCSDSKCHAFYRQTYGINTENAFHDLVTAPKGRAILNIDWSQLEIWVLAYRIYEDLNDRTLLDVLESGVDIHLWMARQMYSELEPDAPDHEWRKNHPDLRRRAKTSNFGIGYGLTDVGFVNREHCTLEEAQDTIKRFKDIVPVDDYFELIRRQLLQYGYVEDAFGRRRHINYIDALRAMGERMEIEAAIREAINMPIQSGGSNLHSLASFQTCFNQGIRDLDCGIILSVHDSLTFELPWPDNDYVHKVAWMIRDLWQKVAWETIKPDGTPLHWRVSMECEWGQTWGTPSMKIDSDGVLHDLS